jgi:tetratricopeptide (TPR) repeat protein
MPDRLDQLTKLHQDDPEDPFITYGIAMEHFKADDLDQAIAWLDKTLAIDGHYCYAYYHKAKALAKRGDAAAAREVLTTGIQAATEANDAKGKQEMTALLDTLG